MVERDPIGVDDLALDDAALEALAEAHAVRPPARLRERVLRGAGPPLRGVPSSVTRWRAVGALAAGIALVLGGLLARERERTSRQAGELAALRTHNADLIARIEQQGRTLVSLREALDSQVHVLQVLSGPRALTAQLAPKGDGRASGRVLVDVTTGDVALVAADLPDLDAGKTYELWAIRGDRPPEPAGVFVPAAGHATAARLPRLTNPSGVSAFAVSIEPTGGSTSPTGPIVLVGAVSS
jgi:anti-sigma-K factor RskA